MSKTYSVKFVCDNCHNPVYKVTALCKPEKKWCSYCVSGKPRSGIPQKAIQLAQDETLSTNLADSLPPDKLVEFAVFDPVEDTEKSVKYYLQLLHIVELLLVTHYKEPEKCHFTKLWDQAKRQLKSEQE